MIKRKLLVTIIAFLSVNQAFSQSAERRLGIEINGGINEYQGDLGSALFFARKPNYQGIGASISYYLTPNIDLSFFGSGGDVGYFTALPYVDPEFKYVQFRTNLATVNGGIRFKFLKDKPFTPYIMLGLGGVYLHSNVSRDPNSYTGAAGNAAAGFGFQFNVNEKFGIRLQSMFNYTFNDIWDGEPYAYLTHTRNKNNDLFAFHSLGFFYNLPYGDASMGGVSQKTKTKMVCLMHLTNVQKLNLGSYLLTKKVALKILIWIQYLISKILAHSTLVHVNSMVAQIKTTMV